MWDEVRHIRRRRTDRAAPTADRADRLGVDVASRTQRRDDRAPGGGRAPGRCDTRFRGGGARRTSSRLHVRAGGAERSADRVRVRIRARRWRVARPRVRDPMTPRNLLILMSDEHNPKVLGSAGDGIVQTPHLDALAAAGTRFTAAYTTCPICVPARASFATGKYVHQVGFWDNADAYDGSIPSWHHHLRAQGHDVVSIGKLHFRGAPGDDHGFTRGTAADARRRRRRRREGARPRRHPGAQGRRQDREAAPAPASRSTRVYDREIAARAQIWLHEAARRERARPWVLFVSFVSPHFPLIAPPEWYYQYAQRGLADAQAVRRAERPHHPFLADYARVVDYDRHFRSPADVQRALAGYYGLVSLVDENVGKVLRALERRRTRRRHARALHERPRRQPRCARTVGQVDVLRGIGRRSADRRRRGHCAAARAATCRRASSTSIPSSSSALALRYRDDGASRHLAREPRRATRLPIAPCCREYHATTSVAGAFMLREPRYKYVPLRRVPAAALRPRARSGGTRRRGGRSRLCRRACADARTPARDARSGRGRRAGEAASGRASRAPRRPRRGARARRSRLHAGTGLEGGDRLTLDLLEEILSIATAGLRSTRTNRGATSTGSRR